MSKKIQVHIQTLNKDIQIPAYAKEGDAGMDIRSSEDVTIHPGETKIVPTGIKVAIPEGYEIQVRPRSGISFKTPLRVSNSPGTIDSGFRDEIGIIITNTSSKIFNEHINSSSYTIDEKDNKPGTYQINKGDRIAQIVLKEVPQIEWVIVKDITKIGTDRKGGFGSSGTK